MVSGFAMACMAATLALCIALPGVGMWILSRRARGVWRAFLAGAVAFFLSQIVLRLPMMSLATAFAPDTAGAFLTRPVVASFSAGLFEETARLVFMLLMLRGTRRLIDGLAFGLGHGGLEAILLVGMSIVNNLVIAVMINAGQWDSFAKTMPPEVASKVYSALVDTAPADFLAGGVERVWAIGLHIACSLIILMGIERDQRIVAWVVAVLVHGFTNLGLVTAIQHGINPWFAELGGFLAVAVLLTVVVWRARLIFDSQMSPQGA
ncbi:YhfC family glutamic-type intramembrane protease [Staphylococcus chromogenes]|nr:YhfC family glutamic-type intramembrane protease [Staphylococcus chromogenes]